MKKTVFDIEDLQSMAPMFKGKVGTWFGGKLLDWLSINKVNDLHANNCHLSGYHFTSAILQDIEVSYQVHGAEKLEQLPTGSFITVSNHPIGSIDGIILIDIFARCRPDFAVMVNGILTNIAAMKENFIAVQPDSKKEGANPANVGGVRLSLQRLKEGHPMGFFPAGAISMYNKNSKKVEDLPWAVNITRLIRRGKVPVYPVLFDGLNSSFFYWLGRIDWRIRTLRIPGEVFNKRGHCFHIYIGDPLQPEELAQYPNDQDLADLLRKETYRLKSDGKERNHSL
ncbi:lysophospholipid acyltransferase family protein [Parabacteroides pacaensis]|uniref:lysophospholipid acyltransferase family protein n=1 Tax=Parabacteroides pacaensis TaxID=2086575 RepID=UPI000D0ED39B|nr:lysophospholipid acyltransferase family protein [Parabacteroides pacaensis]